MTARRLARLLGIPLALAALVVLLAGCGSGGQHAPDLGGLPLVGGARVVAQSLKCDPGVNAYCGWELVVVAPGYRNSDDLLLSEHDRLKALGWTGANADIGGERAADSPGHKLHVTFGTAYTDLKGIDLGWIRRTKRVQLALSRELFEHSPSLSMLLEVGSG